MFPALWDLILLRVDKNSTSENPFNTFYYIIPVSHP
jgi:hypothetical protein